MNHMVFCFSEEGRRRVALTMAEWVTCCNEPMCFMSAGIWIALKVQYSTWVILQLFCLCSRPTWHCLQPQQLHLVWSTLEWEDLTSWLAFLALLQSFVPLRKAQQYIAHLINFGSWITPFCMRLPSGWASFPHTLHYSTYLTFYEKQPFEICTDEDAGHTTFLEHLILLFWFSYLQYGSNGQPTAFTVGCVQLWQRNLFTIAFICPRLLYFKLTKLNCFLLCSNFSLQVIFSFHFNLVSILVDQDEESIIPDILLLPELQNTWVALSHDTLKNAKSLHFSLCKYYYCAQGSLQFLAELPAPIGIFISQLNIYIVGFTPFMRMNSPQKSFVKHTHSIHT